MSIRKFFNEKAKSTRKSVRSFTAAALISLGVAGGGYIGHEIAIDQAQPQMSEFTIAQLSENTTEEEFMRGILPADAVADPLQAVRIAEFRQEITNILRHRTTEGQQAAAVDFINDLRLAENLSEKNYNDLVAEYDARVGIDVSGITGNYRGGIMYWQDAQVASAFMSFFDDEDLTPAEQSRQIGEFMQVGQDMHKTAGMAGALGGAAIGSIFLLPFWIRRRREDDNIKLPLDPALEGHNDNQPPKPNAQARPKNGTAPR